MHGRIYRIAPDGSPSRLWSSHEDLVYALAFDQNGQLLAGTGNRGHVFAIRGEDEFTDLIKASATQVTAFAEAPHGGLYASTSNLGKVFLLSATPASEGSYESDVFDAPNFAVQGTLNSSPAAATWTIQIATGAHGNRSISVMKSRSALLPRDSFSGELCCARELLHRAWKVSRSIIYPKTCLPILMTSRC